MSHLLRLMSLLGLFCLMSHEGYGQGFEVVTRPLPDRNQLKVGLAYVLLDQNDLNGLGFSGQFSHQFHRHYGLSLTGGLMHASKRGKGYPDEDNIKYSILTSINEAPFEVFSSTKGNVLEANLERTTVFYVDIDFHYILKFEQSVLKLGAGGSPIYVDQTFIAGEQRIQYGVNPTNVNELEELVLLIPEYARYSSIGWNVKLDYEYHFPNRFFTNLNLAYHKWTGDESVSLGFGMGVNF